MAEEHPCAETAPFYLFVLSMKHENYIMAGFIYLFLLIKKKVILLICIFIGHQVLRIA